VLTNLKYMIMHTRMHGQPKNEPTALF